MVVQLRCAGSTAVATTHLHRWPRETHAARRRHRRGQLEAQRAGDEQAEDQTSETHRKSQRSLAGRDEIADVANLADLAHQLTIAR